MDLLSIIMGIAIGAAFSPFWIMIWGMIKPKILGLFEKK